MLPRGAVDAETRRRTLCGTGATPDPIPPSVDIDPDKAAIMAWLVLFVADGSADWHLLDNGDIQLRFNTGEILLLATTHITRVA